MRRASNLDALRGFAILTMVLTGTIPFTGLPAWMYHAQLPPPTREFNPSLPGFTWVDLVFPLFLFCLGAAIPLALNRRLQKETLTKTLTHVFERTFLLAFFAVFLFHIRPHIINPQLTDSAWILALIGFAVMFAVFVRLPSSWSAKRRYIFKAASWLAALILLVLLRYPNGGGFSLYRSDIIIIVLTNVYFSGALIWIFTRENHLIRLGVLGILIGFRLAHTEPGWIQWLWDFRPLPWLYSLYYHQYLFVVIPGTIIGDYLISWLKEVNESVQSEFFWSRRKQIFIVLLMFAILLVNLIGLQARWLIFNNLATLGLLLSGWFLLRNGKSPTEKFLKKLFQWACYWMILGLVFEPYEGGIKKDHPTMSYYLITTALSIFLLMGFTIIESLFKKPFWFKLLTGNGRNPMIAYVGFANFIWPLLSLTGLEIIINQWTTDPWIGFLRGLGYTIILSYLVYWLSEKKIYWKT